MIESQYIISIALGQGILLAFFILTSKYYKSVANTWLAVALILISTLCITDLIGITYNPSSIFVEFFVHDLELGFLVYVFLYYFFKISTQNTKPEKYPPYYLYLPFVIDTLCNMAIVGSFTPEVISTHVGIQMFYEMETLVCVIFNLLMSYKSYQLIEAYQGDPDKKNWIYKVWLSTFIILVAWLLLTFSGYVVRLELTNLVLMLYILISIWMFWLIYNGIVNLKLIDDRKNINLKLQGKAIHEIPEKVNIEAQFAQEEIKKNQRNADPKQTVSREVLLSHFEKINEFMLTESLYRNEDLSIEDIAQRVEMSTGYVSKIIKKATDKNFPIWINEFRVADAKAMFVDPDFDNYTTLSIGLEAGFKSKSAFYAAFKKITGETPAKFRKKKS